MPTYEYSCTTGHHFEQFQRMSDEPLDTCPQCGAPAQRQLSAGAGLLFKGSGFYITDYRSDSYRKDAAKDSGSDSQPADSKSPKESSSKESSPAESKPKESAPKESSSKKDSGTKPARPE
jgi:putative FmdB family regulatory protein